MKVPQHLSAYFDICFTFYAKETRSHCFFFFFFFFCFFFFFFLFFVGMNRHSCRRSVYMNAKTIGINIDGFTEIKNINLETTF